MAVDGDGDVVAGSGEADCGNWAPGVAGKTLDGSAACNGAVVMAIARAHPAKLKRDQTIKCISASMLRRRVRLEILTYERNARRRCLQRRGLFTRTALLIVKVGYATCGRVRQIAPEATGNSIHAAAIRCHR